MNIHNLPMQSGMSDWSISDPGNGGAIPVNQSGVCNLRSLSGAETRTLAAPRNVGQRICLHYDTEGGTSVAVTSATTVNAAGNNTITFADVGEFCELIGVRLAGALTWRILAGDIVGTNGPSLSTV